MFIGQCQIELNRRLVTLREWNCKPNPAKQSQVLLIALSKLHWIQEFSFANVISNVQCWQVTVFWNRKLILMAASEYHNAQSIVVTQFGHRHICCYKKSLQTTMNFLSWTVFYWFSMGISFTADNFGHTHPCLLYTSRCV